MSTDQLSQPQAEHAEHDLDESPENLPKRMWATLILFAAFVVGGSSCMISLFVR